MSDKEKFNDIKCVGMANSVFVSLLGLLEQVLDGRAGGYLVVDDKKGLPVYLARMGEIPEEKLIQYYTNGLEKPLRLAYARLFAGHTLSRQSRDENRQRWIGAVVGDNFIWSFSGFPEDCDEIFTVALALRYGDLGDRRDVALSRAMLLLRVGAMDENPHLEKVRSFLEMLAGTH